MADDLPLREEGLDFFSVGERERPEDEARRLKNGSHGDDLKPWWILMFCRQWDGGTTELIEDMVA